MQALKPALYTVPATAGAEVPQFCGGKCSCGRVFFPMQTYGCEKCGRAGDELTPTLLDGKGTLVASARVLMHARPDRKAPFVIVSVKLDAGPVLRTLLAEDTAEHLAVGLQMQACLVEVGKSDAGEPLVDLRFAPLP